MRRLPELLLDADEDWDMVIERRGVSESRSKMEVKTNEREAREGVSNPEVTGGKNRGVG
jgi:hypothetical protein